MKQCIPCLKLYRDDNFLCIDCGKPLTEHALHIENVTYYTDDAYCPASISFNWKQISISLSNGKRIEFTVASPYSPNVRLLRQKKSGRFYFDLMMFRDPTNDIEHRFYEDTPGPSFKLVSNYFDYIIEFESTVKANSEREKRQKSFQRKAYSRKKRLIRERRTKEKLVNLLDSVSSKIKLTEYSQVNTFINNFVSVYESEIYAEMSKLLAYLYAQDKALFSALEVAEDANSLMIDAFKGNISIDVLSSTSSIGKKIIMLSNLIDKHLAIGDPYIIYVTFALLLRALIEKGSDSWIYSHEDFRNYTDIESAVRSFILTHQHTNSQSFHRFTSYAIKYGLVATSCYFTAINMVEDVIAEMEKGMVVEEFESLLSIEEPHFNHADKITIDDVDMMTGKEFECLILAIFSALGYAVKLTKATGDQGVDIVALKNGLTVGIQTKCYGSRIGNSAIQEVVAGIRYYGLNRAMVVTNNYFTQQAIDLAKANDVVLWDRDTLKEKILLINPQYQAKK